MPLRRCLLALSLCFLSGPALAFGCSMTATNIAYGNVDVSAGAPVSSAATLTLTCSGVPNGKFLLMCVSIDGGSGYNGTSRLMNGPGSPQLQFQLYSDSALTAAWGSWPASLYGGGYSWTPLGTTSNGTWTTQVYGQVLANQQTVTPGAYSSALNLSLIHI